MRLHNCLVRRLDLVENVDAAVLCEQEQEIFGDGVDRHALERRAENLMLRGVTTVDGKCDATQCDVMWRDVMSFYGTRGGSRPSWQHG